jgi:exosortase K
MLKLFSQFGDRDAEYGPGNQKHAVPYSLFQSHLFISLAAILLALVLKAFYSRASVSELMWILAPSAWLARYLGGLDLAYEHGAGFISYTHHLVVGSACAGVNFFIICFLCLYFSFARHFTNKERWLLSTLGVAFAATIAANGLRIFVAAYLWNASIPSEWISREDMHRLAGTVIYYMSLLALYFAVESVIGVRGTRAAPLFWYVGISLGVPLAGRLLAEGVPGFAGHALWVVGTVSLLTLFIILAPGIANRIHLRT